MKLPVVDEGEGEEQIKNVLKNAAWVPMPTEELGV